MSTPHFIETTPLSGFDPAPSPPWQVLGVNYTMQAQLVDGAGWAISTELDTRATITEDPASPIGPTRIFELRGINRGVTYVLGEPPGGGPPVRLLELEVKEKLPLKVAFHYVEDNSYNKTTRATAPGFMGRLRRSLLEIFFVQTLLRVEVAREIDIQVPTSLRDILKGQDRGELALTGLLRGPYREWYKLASQGDSSSPINVFFVPRSILVKEQGVIPLIFGMDGNILIEDDVLPSTDHIERGLAQWIAYTSGCPRTTSRRRANHLMSNTTDPAARFIPKDCANILNPTT
jgi:hypothetical protein